MADPLDLLMANIAQTESGGDYSKTGPTTRGDKPYGKYQVMGANIPQWTKETLGQSMTPLQFLNSPQAQEAVARAKLGSFMKQYGPAGAANTWFTGSPHPNPKATDVLGTSAANYARAATAGISNNAAAVPEPGIGSGYPTPAQPNPAAVAAETPPAPPFGGALGQALVALNKGSGADEKGKSVLDQAKDMFPDMKPPDSGGGQIPQAPPLQREAPGAGQLLAQILAQSAKPLSWGAGPPGTMMGAGAGGAAGTASPQAAWQQMMLQRQMAGGSGTPGTTLNTTGDPSYG